jgi:hypothetical protein
MTTEVAKIQIQMKIMRGPPWRMVSMILIDWGAASSAALAKLRGRKVRSGSRTDRRDEREDNFIGSEIGN